MKAKIKGVFAAAVALSFVLGGGTCALADGTTADAQAGQVAESSVTSWAGITIATHKDLYIYEGEAVEPYNLVVMLGDKKLKEDVDYQITGYKNNNKPGTGKVLIAGLGDYAGLSATGTFKIAGATVEYKAGTGKMVEDGKTAGKTSGSKKIKKVSAKVAVTNLSGQIKYRVSNSKKWGKWKAKGAAAAPSSKNAELLQFKLKGELADYYNIYYRVNTTKYGWMGWAKNGQSAGALRIRSVEIRGYQLKLVLKGEGAPGSNEVHYAKAITYHDDDGKVMVNKSQEELYNHMSNFDKVVAKLYAAKVKSLSSSTSYAIIVNTDYNRVGIFKGKKNHWKLADMWACGTGKAGHSTIKGTFSLGSKGYAFDTRGDTGTCYWYSTISGNYLFHSWITKLHQYNTIKYRPQLSRNVSHGCVRLHMNHAKYMYKHIPCGSRIKIYGVH